MRLFKKVRFNRGGGRGLGGLGGGGGLVLMGVVCVWPLLKTGWGWEGGGG